MFTKSRLLLGTAQYPDLTTLEGAIHASGTDIVTVSLRREQGGGQAFWEFIQQLPCKILPNTAGCRTAKEAVTTALMAREIFNTDWIKLEVIGNDYTLQPDPFALVEAASECVKQGFTVFPYCTDDLILCEQLLKAGCTILMPWAAPIGTGLGPMNPYALQLLREYFPDTTLIVDAGLGKPSHATTVMEMGMDGVLLNTAVAKSHEPIKMAQAFSHGVNAGRLAYEAGCMPARREAAPSTPVIGRAFS